MKRFKIRRLSDNEVLFCQERESIDQVVIPAGWGLENNHEIFEEIPTYIELREIQYRKRTDPKLAEAITDYIAGDSTAMNALLAEKALIKLEIPKPSDA